MDVSVIIVNYNTKELTKNCIDYIYKNTKDIEYEIILVDNNSIDGTCEYINSLFPEVIILRQNENLGFGAANNRGIKISKGKYIFLLNSDAIVLNNAIKIFYDYYENHKDEKIGAIGTYLIDENGDIGISYGYLFSFGNLIKEDIFNCINILLTKLGIKSFIKKYIKNKTIKIKENSILNEKEVECISGADLFIRKDILYEIGFFDENIFLYSEENDLQLRMKKNGYKRIIIEGPKIIHLESKSFKIKNNKRINLNISYLYYSKKIKIIFII